MNFFKRYLFKKALLEDELANEERRKKEIVIEKQPEPVAVVEPQVDEKGPVAVVGVKGDLVDSKLRNQMRAARQVNFADSCFSHNTQKK
jgi:hypothetical protein